MNTMKWMMGAMMAAVMGFACVAQADSLSDAKERRKARKAQVIELVQAGDATEGANGCLVAKAGLDEAKAALVKAENTDRKIAYAAIAKENRKTPEEVGKQAAEMIKARAAKAKK